MRMDKTAMLSGHPWGTEQALSLGVPTPEAYVPTVRMAQRCPKYATTTQRGIPAARRVAATTVRLI
eukprot:6122126-Alexandrium_andersonii.AAC.1